MVQPASKRLITEAALPEAVRAAIEASFVAGSGVVIEYDGEADTITLSSPGMELGYVERTTNFSATADATISTFSLTLEGKGRPVEVEFYAPSTWHSSGGVEFEILLFEDGVLVERAVPAWPATSSASHGPSVSLRSRRMLTDGESYIYTVGVHQTAVSGTMTIEGDPDAPMWLGAVSR